MTHDLIGRQTQQMRLMSEEERRIAIAAAPNVIGHKAFLQRFTRVERQASTRDPRC